MTLPTQPQRATLGTYELSAEHDGGVDVILEELGGWGAPASDLAIVKRPHAHGAWSGVGTHGARYVTLQGTIVAPTRDLAVTSFDDLQAAATLTETTLTVVEGALTRALQVKRTGEILHKVTADGCAIEWSMILVAPDPRKTSTAVTGSTGLPATSGGMEFPFTFPFTFDETVTSGRIELTNPGNAPGRVTLRITAGTGGLTGPAVTHIASGLRLEFATGQTIAEGNWIDVDMEAQTVLENGQEGATRNGWVTGRGWSAFEPGVNEWAFTAVSGDGTLSVTATPSWW